MSERTLVFFLVSVVAAVVSGLIFWLSPNPIYTTQGPGADKAPLVETTLKEHLSNNLYAQYKTKTLPNEYVEKYVERVEEGIRKELNATGQEVISGHTEPNFSWMILAFVASSFGVAALFSIVSDSSIYRALCDYWRERARLKAEFNQKQIEVLNQIQRNQTALEQINLNGH